MAELMRQARESSDKPRLNAFCRVAPSDRFSVRAMLDAFVFFRAAVFKVRKSVAVHARRLDFLAILNYLRLVVKGKVPLVAEGEGKGNNKVWVGKAFLPRPGCSNHQ
jgi:hypothetical protein